MKAKTIIILVSLVILTLTAFTGRFFVGVIHTMGVTFITVDDVIGAYVFALVIWCVVGFQALRAIEKRSFNKPKTNKNK